MAAFADRLDAALVRHANPVLVGLDPRADLLPETLFAGPGPHGPEELADAYRRFCAAIIDVVAPCVPAVKPQAAFFEELGPPGIEN